MPSQNPPSRRSPLSAVFLAALLLGGGGGGCTLLENTLRLPGKAISSLLPLRDGEIADPVELQEQLMRFADDYLASVIAASEVLRHDSRKLDPIELQTLQLDYTDDVLAVATGQNAFANLLDMVTLVSLSRATIESYWIPGSYGPSASRLLTTCREGEAHIWEIAKRVLAPEQAEELRKAIDNWHKDNPTPDGFRTVRALGFAKIVAKASHHHDSQGFPSVFNLLNIDPLSGLDPATRELAQTRLFAERALFLAQKMPNLVRQQSDLFALQTAGIPEVRQLVANSTRLAEAADRFSQVAEQLPGVIGDEREKILAALRAERRGLTALAAETRQAFAQGAHMAVATDGTLKTFGAVVAQLKAESGPPDPQAEPFRIADYTAAAERIDLAAARLTGLLDAVVRGTDPGRFEQLAAGFDALGAKAQADAMAVVDYAFRKAVWLIVILCGAVAGTALAYRVMVARLARPGGAGKSPRAG